MTHTSIEKWNKGRFWWHEILSLEWVFFTHFLGIELRFFEGDSDRDIQLFVGCGLFAFWFTIERVLPRKWVPKVDWKGCFGESRTIGFSYHDAHLWFEVWGNSDGYSREHTPWYLANHSIEMPWNRVWVRTSTLLKDGTWHHELKGQRPDWREKDKFLKANRWQESHPYKYTLKSGKEQNRTATIGVEEREWRMKWLLWTKLFRHVSRTISIDFSDEVGERTGSWKGGVLGCGYGMKKGETATECLQRMERERRFN